MNLRRTKVNVDNVVEAIKDLFVKIDKELAERSEAKLNEMIIDVEDLASLRDAIRNRKIARVNWCENIECAETIREESGGEIRGYRFDLEEKPRGPCIACGSEAKRVVYVARAY